MELRNHEGYKQMRETQGNWRYIVAYFDSTSSGQDGYCYVVTDKDTTEKVPIDSCDRILINGKRYGRDHWDH